MQVQLGVVHLSDESQRNEVLQAIREAGFEPPSRTVSLGIAGMTCTQCARAIERVLEGLVDSVAIDVATDTATIQVSTASIEAISEAIESVGYEVTSVTEEDDPQDVDMNRRWQELTERQQEKVLSHQRAFLASLVASFPILLWTMVLPHMSWMDVTLVGPFTIETTILCLLATWVQFVCGAGFYKRAWYGLRQGHAGMDVLVALGTSASYGYAWQGILAGDRMAAHFWETSAVLVCLVLLGKYWQALAVRRTSTALTRLMELQSPTAIVVQSEGESFSPNAYQESVVPIQEVHPGDIVKVIRGSSVPTDAVILFGEISVDESMVTGESLPVLKTPGSYVLGGTICVESGDLGAAFCQVKGVGAQTALAQIIRMVQEAQTRTVPIQSFADHVSSIFVPTVCAISVVTYMVWYALCNAGAVPEHWYQDKGESPMTFSLKFAIACLVISCPCALGLATPTAVMVGTGVGAKLGILMKGGEALEIGSKVNAVIFDKTGTLTKGKPVVCDFIMLDNAKESVGFECSRYHLLWLLGSLERSSEHPLAKAIVEYADESLREQDVAVPFAQPTEFRAVTGRGASGMVNGEWLHDEHSDWSVQVGNRAFATQQSLHISDEVEATMLRLEDEGKTAIVAAIHGEICVVLGITDEIKDDATASISFLRDRMGVDVWMVTGDNRRTARAISEKLGLPANRVISEALPAAKVEKVRSLQASGSIVAMVGDGVNDSPALAQADVGISVGTGAEIATEASDMVLVKGDVTDVCTALHLCRAIFHRIQLNFVWSLLYNCLGIPIAAGVFYPLVHTRLPPTVAALAMALSSISVVLSSLSLHLYRVPHLDSDQETWTSVWSRTFQRVGNESGLLEPLLASSGDFSESTNVVDNRRISRMEEGDSGRIV